MTALHRVKAYFGMVPADELDAYDGYGRGAYSDRYDDRYGDRYADERWSGRYDDRHSDRYPDRYADRYDRRPDPERHGRGADADYDERRYDRDPEPQRARGEERDELRGRTPRPRDPEPELPDSEPASRPASRGRSWASNTGPNHTSVRAGSSGPSRASLGSSGTSSAAAASTGSGSSSSSGGPALAAVPSTPGGSDHGASGPGGLTRGALAVDDAPRRKESVAVAEAPEAAAPAEITTLQPKGYDEARVIGERYRDGIPVIMNLTEMDDVAAKRLVDFAAGLAFALRGSIEKVTNRVFLLSPPNVEVSAHDRRRLAENGFTGPS